MDAIEKTEAAFQRLMAAVETIATCGRWDSPQEFAAEVPEVAALIEGLGTDIGEAQFLAQVTGDTEAAAEGLLDQEMVERVEMVEAYTATIGSGLV